MRNSLVERPLDADDALDELVAAVDALVAGDADEARRLVVASDRIDLAEFFIEAQTPKPILSRLGIVPQAPDLGGREMVPRHSAADARAVHERDGWHCRFCQCRVIDTAARDRIRKIVPEFRWGKANRERHGTTIAHMSSADHVLPRAWGGSNDHSNLVTACWPCQFSRVDLRLDEANIADPFARPPIIDGWDGLRRILSVKAP